MRANSRGFLLGLILGAGGTLAVTALVGAPGGDEARPGVARETAATATDAAPRAEGLRTEDRPAAGRRGGAARSRVVPGPDPSGTSPGAAPAHGEIDEIHETLDLRLGAFAEDEAERAWLGPALRAPSSYRAAVARADTDGRSAKRDDPSALLASSDGGEALIGLVLAARSGRIDLLLDAARVQGDAADGAFERAAVEALIDSAAADARTQDAVRSAWRLGSTTMRATIADALAASDQPSTAILAREFLRERTPPEVQKPLVAAALRGTDAATLLREAADAQSALGVGVSLRHGRGWADPYMTGDGARRADEICDALLPWLRGPGDEALKIAAATFFPEAQRWRRFGDLLADRAVPASVRVATMRHGLSFAESLTEFEGGIAGLLADPGAAPDDIILALASIGDSARTMPSIRAVVERLAVSASDAWVREAARLALQRAEPGDGRSLRIARATYGTANASIDVTAEIRALCVGGRLSVVASNQIASDPDAGRPKTLTVEYVAGGRTFTASVAEGGTLSIP